VDLEDNTFFGTGRREYSVGHSLYVVAMDGDSPIVGDSLDVQDDTGAAYGSFGTRTDANGVARLELLEYTFAAAEGQPDPTRVTHTGHVLLIEGYEPFAVSPELFAIANNGDDPVPIIFGKTKESKLPCCNYEHIAPEE